MNANIWFFGSGAFAARCLEEIFAKNPPALVVTAPPSVAGRGLKTCPTPVEEVAIKQGLRLHHSPSVNKDDELKEVFAQNKPSLILVIDFGQRVGEPWLSEPACGCLNIHPSLLPRYRGAAPVQRAIMNGEKTTGVTLFRLVEKMDAGPIWFSAESPIEPEENSAHLLERMAVLGSSLFNEHFNEILNGQAIAAPQDESLATKADKIAKSESRLDLNLPAEKLHDLVRGLNPAPGAYVLFRGKRLKIIETRIDDRTAARGTIFAEKDKLFLGTSQGALQLCVVQPEGKKAMPAADWLKGLHLTSGEIIELPAE